MSPSNAEIAALVEAVETATITEAAFNHAAHLTVAVAYLERYGVDGAHARLREVLPRLQKAFGVEPTPTSGYHDTLTRAWLLMAEAERPKADLPAQVAHVCAALGDKHAILRHYTKETLASAEARAAFVEPDLAPLTR